MASEDPNPTEATQPARQSPSEPADRQHADPVVIAQAQVGQRYRVERLLGAGGMGRVFAAFDTVLQRVVAIKLLRSESKQTSDGGPESDRTARLLIEEARAMARLDHPGICRILEIAPSGPNPYIVMEWIDGQSLTASWRPMDLDARLSLFERVVDAVAAIHNAGLVHRDLKPFNVIVDRRGSPVIVDFGLARVPVPAESGGLSLCGGTPGYAAPEQFDRSDPGPPADVYALGVMLYELLTDRAPFGGTTLEQLRQARESDPPFPDTIAPESPEALQRICLAAMSRDPADRYPTAQAMLRDLRRFRAGRAVSARPSVIADRFAHEVRTQHDVAAGWLRRGLITRPEYDRLRHELAGLETPESNWIVETRRLTTPHVSLWLGAWIVIVAVVMSLVHAWDDLPVLLRSGAPWVIAALLTTVGLVLQRRPSYPVALAFLLSAALAIPIALWVMFRMTDWLLYLPGIPPEVAERRELLHSDSNWGLTNMRLALISASWLACAVLGRWYCRASAFTLQAALAAGAVWASLWLVGGGLDASVNDASASLGRWMALLGALMLWPAIRLSQQEEARVLELGRDRVAHRDAWPLLTLAVVLLVGGLSAIAHFRPSWYRLEAVLHHGVSEDRLRALAFLVNAGVFLALSWLLGRRFSPTRHRLATLLRWLAPALALGSLLALEQLAGDRGGWGLDGWWLWFAILGAASIALVHVAVWNQWKPFVFTGFIYLAIWINRAFVRIDIHVDGELARRMWHVGLSIGAMSVGLLGMLLGWRGAVRRRPEDAP